MTTTVHEETFDLLRRLGLTTFFGNPGSTEENLLAHFPDDFRYVLALQEASVVAIADGYAQATRKPVVVQLHTAAGTGNGMGNLMGAFQNKTPLIVLAGQQTREMVLLEPWLTNDHPEALVHPYVKWAYEPKRPEDIPAAIMRAYAMAVQPPAGPVYLSLPLDDWAKPSLGRAVLRSVTTRVAPDPRRLAEFAERFAAATSPALVFGADVARSGAWDAAIALAEQTGAPVYASPAAERAPFPEDHPQYVGGLPFAQGPLAKTLEGHDVVLLIGAPVFRYYPWVAGPYLPDGCELLHISDDPAETGRAPVGDSLVGDALLSIEAISALLPTRSSPLPQPAKREQRMAPVPVTGEQPSSGTPLTAREVFAALRRAMPSDTVLVEETASNLADLHAEWPITAPDTFFTFAHGGLGWDLPASVGIALAEQDAGTDRPVLSVIGDGSMQYSIQSIYTAAQHRAKVIFINVRNGEYAILKSFAGLEDTPGVPGLDLPGLDVVSLAAGYGLAGVHASTVEEIAKAVEEALKREGPTMIDIPITSAVPPLL